MRQITPTGLILDDVMDINIIILSLNQNFQNLDGRARVNFTESILQRWRFVQGLEVAGSLLIISPPLVITSGGTGSANGSIAGSGALTFAAGGLNQDVSITPSGLGNTNIGGNAQITLDVEAAGGYKQCFEFSQGNVAANQTAVPLDVLGQAGNQEYVAPYAGSIMGISVGSNLARTAGTLTVDATVNGAATGLQAVLDGVNTQYKATTQAKDTDIFAAGDRIGVVITTTAGWTPVLADIVVTILVEM